MPTPPKVDQPEVVDTEPAVAEPTAGQRSARTLRTFIQAGLIQLGLQVWQAFAPAVYVMDDQQYAIASAFLTALATFVQMSIEDALGAAIMRTPAKPRRR